MSQNSTTDVLICGAGAAGLTLAIDLARRGVAFRLIEKMEHPFRGSRGKGIQPRSLEVFEDLGVVDRLVAGGGLYPPQRVYRDDGGYEDSPMMENGDPTPAEPYRSPLMLPQFMTEGVMRERLAELGHHPASCCELTGFAQDPAGVTARITGPIGEETVRARYLVGSDGGRSFVRQALDIGFPGETLGARAVVADVILEGLGRDAWHRFNVRSTGQEVMLCPLMGTDLFQVQAPIALEGDVDLSAEGLTEMVATRTGRHDILIRSVSWASAFNMHARLVDRYQVGRVFLAGDAAHTHPPTGGQGLNTSVQDAYNLGWKLAAVLAGAPEHLLATYEAERRPIAAEMLGLATRTLEAGGSMRRGREFQQLDLGYPGSSLAMEKPKRSGGILAGDRAPDAPVRGAAGQPTRLFTLFQGPHWTLLGYDVDSTSIIPPRAGLRSHTIGPRGDIIDDGSHMRDAYGVSPGDLVLVRPDGYVGAVVSASEVAALCQYLAEVGVAPRDYGLRKS